VVDGTAHHEWVGIDLHARRSVICRIDDQGREIDWVRIEARRGQTARNIAKVAAARRMIDLIYYTLRDGQARALASRTAA
jgi:hypothetical protein